MTVFVFCALNVCYYSDFWVLEMTITAHKTDTWSPVSLYNNSTKDICKAV